MLNITRKPIKANRTKCNTPFIYCVLLRTAQTANDANTKGNSNGKCKSIRNPIQITSLYVIASHKQSTCRKWETTNIEARVLQCDWPQVVPSDWRTQWDFAYLLLAMLARHNLSWENRQWQRHGNLFWTLHVIFTFEHLQQPKIVARAQCTMTMLLPYDTWFRSFIKFVCFAFLRDAAAYAQNTCYWAHCVCVCGTNHLDPSQLATVFLCHLSVHCVRWNRVDAICDLQSESYRGQTRHFVGPRRKPFEVI